jgi:hypothetical protein
MTTLFRSIRLIALAAWVGSLVFFGFVAQVAFTSLPDTHQAGLIVRGSLIALHHLGLIAGLVYLACTLGLLVTQSDTHPVRAAELALVIAMLALTAYSQFSVIPRMDHDRLALAATTPGGVDTAPAANPARQHFDRLHKLSVKLEGAVLIEGLILLVLATIHGHDYRDRFA